MLLSIPPKYAVSQVVGYIKGKSPIRLARVYGKRKRNFVGQHFWARGFFVNTVGREARRLGPSNALADFLEVLSVEGNKLAKRLSISGASRD
jgi:Transposase IS200 like